MKEEKLLTIILDLLDEESRKPGAILWFSEILSTLEDKGETELMQYFAELRGIGIS